MSILQGSASKPARFALVFFHTHVQGYFCVPVCLLFQHEEKSKMSNTLLLKPKDVLVNFCATQQCSYIFEH